MSKIKIKKSYNNQYFGIKTVFLSAGALIVVALCLLWCLEYSLTTQLSSAAVQKKLAEVTGYEVNISGPWHWQYRWHPQINIQKITLSTAGVPKIVLENARVSLALLPLLKKEVALTLYFEQWQQHQLHFSAGRGQLHFNPSSKVLRLFNVNAHFYQGSLQGEAEVDLSASVPRFKINAQASQVEIAEVLRDIAHTALVSGKATLHAQLSAHGTTTAGFMQSLTGNLSVVMHHGQLRTIRLSTQRHQADVFEQFTLQQVIKTGLAHTTLQLHAKNYRAAGSGEIDLPSQHVHLTLQVFYTRSVTTKNIPTLIYIVGPMTQPRVTIDLSAPLSHLLASNAKIVNRLKGLWR